MVFIIVSFYPSGIASPVAQAPTLNFILTVSPTFIAEAVVFSSSLPLYIKSVS
ncbi:TPA: hypothetical protein ITS83_002249 [Enterococcus faecalis]|nr:hypothetical protein [Enterococcus faecalis]